MTTLIIATRNAHKVQEIRAILGETFRYLTLHDFPGVPAVREDAITFAGNATKKAVELTAWISQVKGGGWPESSGESYVLADDSGLEVDALQGAPGVHSARFAALDSAPEDNSSDAANNAKLLRLLRDVPVEKRTARFRCVMALTPVPAPKAENNSPVCSANEFELRTEIFEGWCEGLIAFEPHGQGGFGYDPLFIPSGFEKSFAELGEQVKNQLSHRARTLAKVKPHLLQLASYGTH